MGVAVEEAIVQQLVAMDVKEQIDELRRVDGGHSSHPWPSEKGVACGWEAGGWEADGRWQVAGGRWQVAGGRWQVASGRW